MGYVYIIDLNIIICNSYNVGQAFFLDYWKFRFFYL